MGESGPEVSQNVQVVGVAAQPGAHDNPAPGGGMCSVDKQPSPSDFMANLRQPMPLGKKVRLVARNLAVRIRKRSDCCGHAGEPGG